MVKHKTQTIPKGWKTQKFKEIFDRSTKRNTELNDNVLTISAQYGLVSQNRFFKKNIAGANLSNYLLLRKGDFAYNRSYSSGYPIGVIKRLDLYEKGIVSSLYLCFRPKNKIQSDYLKHYFDSGVFNKEMAKIVQEGARNHGLLNLSIRDFCEAKLTLPPLLEQNQIVQILETWNKYLTSLDKKIQIKKKIKKGLMQNLLTGKKRLNGFSDAWKTLKLGDILKYEQPWKYIVRSDKYSDDYKTPVLTANKSFILGYTNESSEIYQDIPVIIFDDFTTLNKYVDFPFKVKSSAIKLLKSKNDKYNLKFLFERIQLIPYVVGEHKRCYISEYQFIDIKIPDIEEQNAIANILTIADQEIKTLEKQKEIFQNQKKYLLNNLITGRIRV